MPLWYGILVFTRVVEDLYHKGMKPYLVLSQVIKDVAFSCFISYEAQDWTQLRQYVKLGKKLTTAFMLISYPDIMITNNYETIKKNRYLYALFKSHPYTAKLLKEYELRNGYLESPEDIKQYYQAVAGENPFLKIWNTILDIAENIPDMFRKWGEVITSLFYTKREDPFAFATHIISEYAKKAESVKLYNTPADVVEYYTSYAPYLIPSLIAYATIFGVYEDILNSMSEFKCDKGLFLKYPAPYFYQGKLLALGRPQPDGKIIWTIKYEDILKGLPRKYRDKWISGIVIEDDLGNSKSIQCNEILDFIPLFQNLHYTDYTYYEDIGLLKINIEIQKILQRHGITAPPADLSKGAIIYSNGEFIHYDASKWIDILNFIKKIDIKTAYLAPGGVHLMFVAPEQPKKIPGTPIEIVSKWEIGETDLCKAPFYHLYYKSDIFRHFCDPLDPEKYPNQVCYAKWDSITVDFSISGFLPPGTYWGSKLAVRFYDKELTEAEHVEIAIWIINPEEDGTYLLLQNTLPIYWHESGEIDYYGEKSKALFFKKLLDPEELPGFSHAELEGKHGWHTIDYIQGKKFTYNELGTDYNTLLDLYNQIKAQDGWTYYPQQE